MNIKEIRDRRVMPNKILLNSLFPSNKEISEPSRNDMDVRDPEVLKTQDCAIRKSSYEYFNKPPVYPYRTVLRELPENVLGAELEKGYRKYIIYDPVVFKNRELKQKVAVEEAIHLQQEGKEALLPVHVVYYKQFGEWLVPFAIVPIGRILYEGGVQPIAEKSDLKKPNGYPKGWYELAKDIDREIPLKTWYNVAQRDLDRAGEADKVLDFLADPKISKIIDSYVLNPKGNYII